MKWVAFKKKLEDDCKKFDIADKMYLFYLLKKKYTKLPKFMAANNCKI